MRDFQPIQTAPRDGTPIEVRAIEEGFGPYLMKWNPTGYNPLVSSGVGIWEDVHGNFTWSEDHGHGPELWRLPSHVEER